MHHLRSLMERHRVKLPAGDMDEAQERAAALDSFAAGGWLSTKRQPPPSSVTPLAGESPTSSASHGCRSDTPGQQSSSRSLGEIKGGKRLMGADGPREDPESTSSSSSKRRSSNEIGKRGSSGGSASSSELPSPASPTVADQAAAPAAPSASSSSRRSQRTFSRQSSMPSSTVSSPRGRKRPTQRSTSSGAVTGGVAAQLRPSAQVFSPVALRPVVPPPNRPDMRGAASRSTQENNSTDIGTVNEGDEQHPAR